MKYVKTDDKIYISIGNNIEVVDKQNVNFIPVLELLQNNESDREVITLLFGDVVSKAKDALSNLGKRGE